MKKFLASILCIALMLSTVSFGVVAEIQHPERSIEVTASVPELYADETVKIDVAVHGDDMANAEWTLEYKPEYFELVKIIEYGNDGTAYETDVTDTYSGVINDLCYKDDGNVYASNYILKSYVFKALAQTEQVTGNFEITSARAYTYLESILAYDIEAGINTTPVTILLYDYEIGIKFDGEDVVGEDLENEKKSLPYDDAPHTFEVTTIPSATVSYTIMYKDPDGNESEVTEIKAEGEYTITYKVESPELGFAPVEETFTVVINSPEYVIEVVESYVAGYNIVLAYTSTTGVYFKYDNLPMTDVSVRGYTYEGTPYDRVFAYVIDASTGTTEEDFKSCVSHNYDATGTRKVEEYNADLNLNGTLELQDITVGFGVYNVVSVYYDSCDPFQVQILKSDITGDKHVKLDDTSEFVGSVLNTEN